MNGPASLREAALQGRPETEVAIFVHIPKTAGSTMRFVIGRQYPQDAYHGLSYANETSARFFALTPEQRARLRCVAGHIPFGFHEHLPGGPFAYFTLLREPVERFISEHAHQVRNPRQLPWHAPASRTQSPEAYLDYRVKTNSIDLQTRFISGYLPEPDVPLPWNPLPDDALEVAKQNLRDHFAVVGVTDGFDETLLLLRRRMGWTGSMSYTPLKTAPERSSTEGLPPELVAHIRQHTRLDAELYQCAATLLAEAVDRAGPAFQHELQSFKRRNHLARVVNERWKGTPLWKIRNAPGIRQGRRLIGSLLAEHL